MSDLTRGSARGTVWQTLSQLALAGAGYVVAVILARGLGPADFGVYGVIYSFLMALEVIVLIGIPGAVSRLIAEGQDEAGEISGTGLALVMVVCCIAFGVLWIAAPFIARTLGLADGAHLIRIAVIDVPFFGAYFLVSHILNGRRDFVGQSVGTFLYAGSKVVSLIVLAAVGLTVAGAFIANIATSVVGLAYVTWRAGARRLHVTRTSRRRILGLALSIASFALATQVLLSIDLWFLGALGDVPQATLGEYAAAKNLARVPFFIASVMNAILVPSIAYAVAREDRTSVERIVNGGMRFLALTLVPGCALIATDARGLMTVLFSEQYAGGALYLQLLVVANGLLQTLCSTLITILIAMRRQRVGSIIAIVTIVPGVVLNAVLVPMFGALGAGGAALASAAIGVLIAGIVVHRYVGKLLDVSVLLRVILATAVVCTLGAVLPGNGMWLIGKLVSLAVLFAALAVALRLVDMNDLALVRGTRKA